MAFLSILSVSPHLCLFFYKVNKVKFFILTFYKNVLITGEMEQLFYLSSSLRVLMMMVLLLLVLLMAATVVAVSMMSSHSPRESLQVSWCFADLFSTSELLLGRPGESLLFLTFSISTWVDSSFPLLFWYDYEHSSRETYQKLQPKRDNGYLTIQFWRWFQPQNNSIMDRCTERKKKASERSEPAGPQQEMIIVWRIWVWAFNHPSQRSCWRSFHATSKNFVLF